MLPCWFIQGGLVVRKNILYYPHEEGLGSIHGQGNHITFYKHLIIDNNTKILYQLCTIVFLMGVLK